MYCCEFSGVAASSAALYVVLNSGIMMLHCVIVSMCLGAVHMCCVA